VSPVSRGLAPEVAQLGVTEMLRLPATVMAQLLEAMGSTPPGPSGQRRVAVMVCADDPLARPDALARTVAALGPEALITLPTGGHTPHMQLRDHPEHTAHNVAAIVRQIDSMMLTALESTHTTFSGSGPAGPTLAAGSTSLT
jgi:hypothetical protein